MRPSPGWPDTKLRMARRMDSTTVPDGTYTLQAEAIDGAGLQAFSKGVTVIVENTPPTTSILIPSSGASLSGSQVVLDAGASLNVGVNQCAILSHRWIAEQCAHRHGDSDPLRLARDLEQHDRAQRHLHPAERSLRWGWLPGSQYGGHRRRRQPAAYDQRLDSVERRLGVGAQVILDASAPLNVGVNQVEILSHGGSLNNALIATATPTYLRLARVLGQHDSARRHLHPAERSLRWGWQPGSQSCHLCDSVKLNWVDSRTEQA